MASVRKDRRIIAAAGWAPWPARTAHLCAFTAADARGRGLAAQAAAAYRGRARGRDAATVASPIGASQRVAAKLGYRVRGQLSLQLHT